LEKEILERNKQDTTDTSKALEISVIKDMSSQPIPVKKVIKKSIVVENE
jgi:hypothetical protein